MQIHTENWYTVFCLEKIQNQAKQHLMNFEDKHKEKTYGLDSLMREQFNSIFKKFLGHTNTYLVMPPTKWKI